MTGGVAMETLHEKVIHLDELLGVAFLESSVTLLDWLDNVAGNIEALAQNLGAFIM